MKKVTIAVTEDKDSIYEIEREEKDKDVNFILKTSELDSGWTKFEQEILKIRDHGNGLDIILDDELKKEMERALKVASFL
jgi:hypothetical protein